MKKIIIAMAAIAAAFTMASCNKEQPVSPNDNPTTGKSVITASIENDITKTTLEGNDDEGYKVFWSEGDNLFVCDEGGSRNMNWVAEYKLEDSSVGSPKGTFSWYTGDYFISLNQSYQEPVFENGNVYVATYPFDLTDLDDYRLIWKTEQTYSTTDRYIPMYGIAECTKDGEADFKFTNLGGMLRLTVKGSAYIRSIKISAAENEAMSGSFLVDEDDNDNMVGKMGYGDVENYIILDCGANGVRLSEEGTDFYISMPCHYIIDEEIMKWVLEGYSDVTITLTDTEGRTCVKKLNNKNLVIERSKITTATFTASEFKSNVPEGALPGKFSVAEGKQVQFSSGNLTATVDATGAPTAWKFAANQYDYLGEGGANMTIGTAAGDVDLFGWSTAATAYGISASTNVEDYSGAFVDWGKTIGDGNTWRTLTTKEWQYLFGKSGKRDGRFKYDVTVCGYPYCIVIAPDDWDIINEPLKQNYTILEWESAEAAGLVCLPPAGVRSGSYGENVGSIGLYWSSSAFGESDAYYIYFDSDPVLPDDDAPRSFGMSVRLVTESK